MGETIKYTDLSDQEPGPRAVVDAIELGGTLVGIKLWLKARMPPGSPLHRLVATVALVLCGCACTLTLSIVGLPAWAAAGALLLPAGIYIGFSPRRRNVGVSGLPLGPHSELRGIGHSTAPATSRVDVKRDAGRRRRRQ